MIESELKHGRLSMIAAIAIPFSEAFHPFWPNLEGPGNFTFCLFPFPSLHDFFSLTRAFLLTCTTSTTSDPPLRANERIHRKLLGDPIGVDWPHRGVLSFQGEHIVVIPLDRILQHGHTVTTPPIDLKYPLER